MLIGIDVVTSMGGHDVKPAQIHLAVIHEHQLGFHGTLLHSRAASPAASTKPTAVKHPLFALIIL
jgi:hypothetical protein